MHRLAPSTSTITMTMSGPMKKPLAYLRRLFGSADRVYGNYTRFGPAYLDRYPIHVRLRAHRPCAHVQLRGDT